VSRCRGSNKKLDRKKVLIQPSQTESTKGKNVVIGEVRQLRMIRPKNLEIGRWMKNERSKPRSHPKAMFDIFMAKYRDGKADIRGRKNRTIQFPKLDHPISLDQASTFAAVSSFNNQFRAYHGEIQKVKIIVNRSIIRHLTSQLGHQCLGHGGLRQ
jgi:hypothetical protein